MQDKCSLMQLQFVGAGTGAKISMGRCVGHKGMMELLTTSQLSFKAAKCTNCSGCQECKQPVPLAIPEGTGGSGCSAEVAAKAEALRCPSVSKQEGQADPWFGGSASGAQANIDPGVALVECSVCHRRPGEPGVPATMKLCGGCHRIRYCSADCQKKDWKMGHKELCQAWARD
jgi:hypothetical protein